MRKIKDVAIDGHNAEYDFPAADPIILSNGDGGSDTKVCKLGDAVIALVKALST
jgi:hypothetical protein